jgi:serine/threonine protein kinase
MRFTHQPGAQPLAGFTIQRGIHRGGFGEVYYAHSDGGKEVALKLLQHEQEVELRGVRQCLNLKHPNLINLFDVRSDDAGEQWVVMEYVNGTSLEDVLASFPNGLPLSEVQEWLKGIAAGVTYLHERGIVHRDLKPANVYRENGTVKVGDVGLSKRLGSDRRAAHTQSVGTVYYMAPEVANGQYGPGVDVYSMGIMLYEMLTGQLPFMGETTGEVLMKHLTATPNLERVPASFRGVLAKSLAKDPAQRQASVMQIEHEFAEALRSMDGKGPSLPHNGKHNGHKNATLIDTPHSNGINADTVRKSTVSPARAASAYSQFPPEPKAVPVSVSASPEPRSATKRKFQSNKTSTNRPAARSQSPVNWKLLAVVCVGLLLFAPGTRRSWSGAALIGAACIVTWVLRGRNGRRLDSSVVSIDPTVDVQVCQEPPAPPQAVADAAASLAVGSVSACLISAGAIFAPEFFQRIPKAPTAEFVAMFTTTSLAATWLLLLANQARERWTWWQRNPRKSFFAIGLLLATVAYFLDQYLLVDYFNSARYSPAVRSLGVHPLINSEMHPTWLGFAVFFGGMMFWHRWWQDMSPKRKRQLSIGRLATSAVAAWFLTIIFAFPQTPAILWALTISAAVQLATPIASSDRRVSGKRC